MILGGFLRKVSFVMRKNFSGLMFKTMLKKYKDYIRCFISIYHLISLPTFVIYNAFFDTVKIWSVIILFICEIVALCLLILITVQSD